jgi:hypothetical protein
LSTPVPRAKIQKGKPLTEDEYSTLRAKRLIEGRRPDFFVSAEVAVRTEMQESELSIRCMISRNRFLSGKVWRDKTV